MIIACATNDFIHLSCDHFGDASHYQLFEIDPNQIQMLETIENTSLDEYEIHHHKALHILDLFREHGVNAVMNQAFGKNIKTIVSKTIPILTKIETIDSALRILKDHLNDILIEQYKNKQFYINLSKENGVIIHEI
ncbi:MAG: hypothetical protein JXB08_00060 [Bacilli bacterium]|nr:hypothetical protein [Bacilli bacterium]MBN2876539.1 hypothetical protein [Bacilli bacterium]